MSFSARQLAVSPDSKYLLVSTDTSRIALLRIQGLISLKSDNSSVSSVLAVFDNLIGYDIKGKTEFVDRVTMRDCWICMLVKFGRMLS